MKLSINAIDIATNMLHAWQNILRVTWKDVHQSLHHRQLAIKQDVYKARHTTILEIWQWASNDWWKAVKGRQNIPTKLQAKALVKAQKNIHMGIEETRLLVWDSLYWLHMSAGIEDVVKYCSTCLEFQQTQPKNKIISQEPRWAMGNNRCQLICNKNSSFRYVVDYHNRFPIVKWAEELLTENLIRCCKTICAEYGLLQKMLWDASSIICR